MDNLKELLLRRTKQEESVGVERQDKSAEADEDLLWLAKQPRGQRFLKRLFRITCFMDNTLETLRTDEVHMPYRLMYMEGLRSVGYRIYKDLKRVAPDICGKVLIEPEEEAHG